MPVSVSISPALTQLRIGVVEAEQVLVAPASAELRQYCRQIADQAKLEFESSQWSEQCQEVRQLLRHGQFKPTGRSKPAQEYLMRCVINDGGLPEINAPVDLLNAVSVEFNLPISLLSIAKCSTQLFIDRGQADDRYAFNAGGQTLDLADLITVYDISIDLHRPVGSPVKDSMAGKIETGDRHVVAIIYAPNSPSAIERCNRAKLRLSSGFVSFCGANFIE